MANGYQGLVEGWKLDLIRARMRGFKIPPHEEADVEQQLVLVVSQFRYDAGKSNGASERTVLSRVITNHLISRKRAGRRAKKHGRAHRRHVKATAPVLRSRSIPAYEDEAALRLDVRLALEDLSPLERAVCEGIAQGHSKSRVARNVGRCYETVCRTIRRLRRRFRRMGLDGWLDD